MDGAQATAVAAPVLGATWNVAAFPIMIPLPTAPVPWDLDPWALDFPLPEVEIVDMEIAFGLAATGTNQVRSIPLYNDGNLPLEVTLTSLGVGLNLLSLFTLSVGLAGLFVGSEDFELFSVAA